MTAKDIYALNDVIGVIGRFYTKDPLTGNKTLADPTTVKCYVETPGNSVEVAYVYLTAAEITRLSIGIFLIELSANKAGTWRFRWDGDGSVEASDEDYCIVQPSKVLG